MGAGHSSIDHIVKKEVHDFDVSHLSVFKKIEQALHNERCLNFNERKDLDSKINNFIKGSLTGHEEQFEAMVQGVMKVAKQDKVMDDERYKGIIVAWQEIIKRCDPELKVDIKDATRDSIISKINSVYAKEKEVSDFQYDKEVLSPLEVLLYNDKLHKDAHYKELLIHMAEVIKYANLQSYNKHTGNTFIVENEVNMKDKEYSYHQNIVMQRKFDQLFQKPVKNDTDVAKHKQEITDIVTEGKEQLDKNRHIYTNLIASMSKDDQHYCDIQYNELINKLRGLVNGYLTHITVMNRVLPEQITHFIHHGCDIIYNNYRVMKYGIYDVIREEPGIATAHKNALIDALNEYRKVNKVANQSIMHTQHVNTLPAVQQVIDEYYKNIETSMNEVMAHVTRVIAQDKAYMDEKRAAIYKKLDDLMHKDQEISDVMMKELIFKIDKESFSPAVTSSSVFAAGSTKSLSSPVSVKA
jgi:hypothetical protein